MQGLRLLQGFTTHLTRLHQCPDDDEDCQGRHDVRRCDRPTELDQLRLVAEARSR